MISSETNLRTLVTNILDLSQIDAGKMEVAQEQFNATALISEIAETTRILIGKKPVTVEVTVPAVPVMVTTDPIKVRQIVTNLTNNAAKCTKRGTISITLSIIGSSMEIKISDTGIGVREEDLHRLFTVGQIEDAATKQQNKGTDLSLTISKNIVGLLGGTVSVTSTFDKGTTFIVSLPLLITERQGALYNVE